MICTGRPPPPAPRPSLALLLTPTPTITRLHQFAIMDKDGNGTLTYDELQDALLSMPGLQSLPRSVRAGFDWDWSGSNWIGLDQIGLDWIGSNWIGLDCVARMPRSSSNCRRVHRFLCPSTPQCTHVQRRCVDSSISPYHHKRTRREKLEELFSKMDEDGTEGVSQEEFIAMFQHIATKCVAATDAAQGVNFVAWRGWADG